jgi:VWFA-related protein
MLTAKGPCVRTRFCLLGALLLSSITLPAQHQLGAPDGPVFRESTVLLTIDAVVTDRDGKPVTDLTRDDFEVTVAGKHRTLEQAVYIKTQDQPQALAAVRAAGPSPLAPTVPAESRPGSLASRTVRNAGTTPDHVSRTIALVVDDLGLSFESTYYVRNAIHKYIDTQIEPGDLVAIIRTAGGVGALQQFTTDKRLLHMAADRLKWDFRSRHLVGAFDDAAPNKPSGLDSDDVDELHDSMSSVGSMGALEYIAGGVSELPGRKCIIYFSEGFASLFEDRMGSGESRTSGSERIWKAMARMLTRANAAGVVIYTIDARGLQTGGLAASDNPLTRNWGPGGVGGGAPTGPGSSGGTGGGSSGSGGGTGGGSTGSGGGAGGSAVPAIGSGAGFLDAQSARIRSAAGDRLANIIDSQESLKFIADQTGGLAIENTNDLNLGITRVLNDQQGYYLLGYTGSKDSSRPGWDQDRVKVHVKRSGLRVRARQGFFGPFDASTPKPRAADPLVLSAISPFGSSEITVRLTSMFAHDAKAGSYVRSLVFIDPGDLRFEIDQAGKHTARFQVLVMAIGDNGQLLEGWRREVPLALTEANFQRIKEHGLVITVRTAAKQPGPYQMRVAVEDLNSMRVGSASQFLEVPQVGGGRLALSGVLLKGVAAAPEAGPAALADAPEGLVDDVLLEPEVRVLSPGDKAVYAFEIYDGLKGQSPELQMATAVLRDGKAVFQSEFTPVTVNSKPGPRMRAIPIAGTLNLGADMPAGPYTLEVTVRARDTKRLERRQWLDFEIRR